MFKSPDYVKYMENRFHEGKDDYMNRMYLRMKSRYIVAGDCFEFTGNKNNRGYGIISFNIGYNKRTSMSAHRFIYMMHHKLQLTKQDVVMHSCDNPSCINVEHLSPGNGTHMDNVRDKYNKGRANSNFAFTKYKRVRKLTDEQVRAIRCEPGSYTHVANIFGISKTHVSQIKNGKRKQLVD